MISELGPIGREMVARFNAQLSPTSLLVDDQSAAHAGHSGARPEGETHFHVEISSAAFEGLSRLARQRLVYDCVTDLMASRVHALSIKTQLP